MSTSFDIIREQALRRFCGSLGTQLVEGGHSLRAGTSTTPYDLVTIGQGKLLTGSFATTVYSGGVSIYGATVTGSDVEEFVNWNLHMEDVASNPNMVAYSTTLSVENNGTASKIGCKWDILFAGSSMVMSGMNFLARDFQYLSNIGGSRFVGVHHLKFYQELETDYVIASMVNRSYDENFGDYVATCVFKSFAPASVTGRFNPIRAGLVGSVQGTAGGSTLMATFAKYLRDPSVGWPTFFDGDLIIATIYVQF